MRSAGHFEIEQWRDLTMRPRPHPEISDTRVVSYAPSKAQAEASYRPKWLVPKRRADVRFGSIADITELGFHQRLDFTSLIVVFVAPLPFHCSPLSSSPAKQLG